MCKGTLEHDVRGKPRTPGNNSIVFRCHVCYTAVDIINVTKDITKVKTLVQDYKVEADLTEVTMYNRQKDEIPVFSN